MVITNQLMRRGLVCWGDGKINLPSKLLIECSLRPCCRVRKFQMPLRHAKPLHPVSAIIIIIVLYGARVPVYMENFTREILPCNYFATCSHWRTSSVNDYNAMYRGYGDL